MMLDSLRRKRDDDKNSKSKTDRSQQNKGFLPSIGGPNKTSMGFGASMMQNTFMKKDPAYATEQRFGSAGGMGYSSLNYKMNDPFQQQ